MGMKRKIVWQATLMCIFWIVWKEINNRAFEDEGHSIQKCKCYFLCNPWAWAKGFLVFGPSFVVDFVDWLGYD